MGIENWTYLCLIIIAFGMLTYTGKLIEVRIRKETLLRRFKHGSIQYKSIQKLLSPIRLVIGIFGCFLSVGAIVFYVGSHNHRQNFAIILISCLIVVAISFGVSRILLGSDPNNIAQKAKK